MSWFESSFCYQIYPLGLCGAPYENDGILSHRLCKLLDDGWIEHLNRLGVSCLILNPVFESLSHGYDTSDYTKVASWSTLAMLRVFTCSLMVFSTMSAEVSGHLGMFRKSGGTLSTPVGLRSTGTVITSGMTGFLIRHGKVFHISSN